MLETDQCVKIALEAIQNACIILKKRRYPLEKHFKDSAYGIKEAVTRIDIDINRSIMNHIKENTPGDIIIGEEISFNSEKSSKNVWLIDPIDGTRSLIKDQPGCSVMISMLSDHVPVMSVIHDIYADLTICAILNRGVFICSGKSFVRMTMAKKYEKKILWNPFANENFKKIIAEKLNMEMICHAESTGLRAFLMAKGCGTIFLSLPKSARIWDTAPAFVIISEIGGQYTDLSGNNLIFDHNRPVHENGAVATIGMDHQKVLASITPCLTY
ncbi:inositol monophosphatase family protein [Desulfobacterales bacterium HSG16]|nr:inositol monophosphatase family protein [Desulfobacterales bacterium HSG16]